MPTYTYYCDECDKAFELFSYIKDYKENPPCLYCNNSSTRRSIVSDVIKQRASVKKSDSELKTIGDLANRNRDRLSNDEKITLDNKHNSYKNEESQKKLPSGMTRLKKQPKTKWM
jgi:putative FmdB family regulatory protein